MAAQLALTAVGAWYLKVKNPEFEWPLAVILAFSAVYWINWGILKLIDAPVRAKNFFRRLGL